ncbi:plasma-membrane proton-efflux P-type ATPase [Acinetobacter sp. ANC 4558]|uniref:plasma-membrane proton-efflux P-type ATPase n=1 Tax=Acinetobacter sp. ANC 4558 TaxID=1977876 RepID=UPI000A333ACC|nr:plasma-membrane proton-efflux P-type ATPase [Acinetobacter sp. ANC 4558]OTG82476.1 plasma-membrane proton-efflux P-type ATPase [Acinetobacter sp. ANC 4558]
MEITNASADSPADSTKSDNTSKSQNNSTTLDAVSIQKKLDDLQTSSQGLTNAEVQKRLTQYGPNAIEAHEESRWKKLLGYFWGPIPWMIEAAALISLFRQDWPDFFVITILLLYNAVVGFWQDNKAASALAALKQGLAAKAHVLRDGKWDAIDSAQLVPGDIVTVSGGEILPADLLLIDGQYLSVDQAALTGESLPVSRGIGDTVYSGSIARQGSMTGVVTLTGNNTFFGHTAKLVASAGSKSHAEEAVLKIGDFLILLAVTLAVILIGVQVYRDIVTVGHWEWSEAGRIAQFVLVLLVASVPVAMPAVMSVTKALGALTLSKQKAIVSRLSAIEELAGVDVLCSDKTGTLTLNQLTLQEPITFNQTSSDDIILAASLACQRQSTDALDLAVLKALKDPNVLDQYKAVDFVPFDPVNKKTVGIVSDVQGQKIQFAKGAPQAIGKICGIGEHAGADQTSQQYFGQVAELAKHGTRALGVARSNDDGKTWILLGILPLLDPPRPDAKETIEKAKALGLSVKMVTGDDVAIGSEISRQLGLGQNLLSASDVFKNDKDPNHIHIDTARAVENADGFGRVFPEHKYEIVKALQQQGHIVAMTGDGVNDAPALKQADCGVAVSGATDAARSAAAIVLTAPGLSTIISAIIEARKIFERITSYVYYRVAMTIAIMCVVVLSYIIFDLQPLTAIMIVVLALLDDIPIMTIAYDNVKVSSQPVRWNMHRIISFSSVMGIIALAQSFGMVLLCKYWMNNPELMNHIPLTVDHLQTMVFLQLAAGGQLLIFIVRNRGSIFARPFPNQKLLLAILATQIIAILLCAFGIFVPALPLEMIGVVWIYVLIWLVIANFAKIAYYKFMDRRESHH